MLLIVSSQEPERVQTNVREVLQQGRLHGQLVQISVQQRMDAFWSRISCSSLRHRWALVLTVDLCHAAVSLAIVLRR